MQGTNARRKWWRGANADLYNFPYKISNSTTKLAIHHMKMVCTWPFGSKDSAISSVKTKGTNKKKRILKLLNIETSNTTTATTSAAKANEKCFRSVALPYCVVLWRWASLITFEAWLHWKANHVPSNCLCATRLNFIWLVTSRPFTTLTESVFFDAWFLFRSEYTTNSHI